MTSDSSVAASLFEQPPTPFALRREMLDLVYHDLLGPKDGLEEELDEMYVSERYLVGMLAPLHQSATAPVTKDTEADSVSSEEDEEESSLAGNTMFPSSLGFSCVVPPDVTELQVGVCWGHYTKGKSAELLTEGGNPEQVWKREPRHAVSGAATLQDGDLLWKPTWGNAARAASTRTRWEPCEEQPEVWIQGRARMVKEQWVVSFFLVNGQREPENARRARQRVAFSARIVGALAGRRGGFSPDAFEKQRGRARWRMENRKRRAGDGVSARQRVRRRARRFDARPVRSGKRQLRAKFAPAPFPNTRSRRRRRPRRNLRSMP